MNVYAYFYLNLVTSTCNTTMFMYIPVLVLQYLMHLEEVERTLLQNNIIRGMSKLK